jgi:hypothetical protein
VEGEAAIRVRPEIGGSSLLEEVGEADITATYNVPVRRFDSLFTGAGTRPAPAKIDVQGAELSVLRGMGEEFRWIDLLVIETSLIATLRGGAPEASDVIGFLHERGFVLFDIVGMTRRPRDRALAQIDAVLVPSGSPLRADRRWAL